MSAWLNNHLIFCAIPHVHVKYKAILKIMLLYLVEKVWGKALSILVFKIWDSSLTHA